MAGGCRLCPRRRSRQRLGEALLQPLLAQLGSYGLRQTLLNLWRGTGCLLVPVPCGHDEVYALLARSRHVDARNAHLRAGRDHSP